MKQALAGVSALICGLAVAAPASTAADMIENFTDAAFLEVRQAIDRGNYEPFIADLYSRARSQNDPRALTILGLVTQRKNLSAEGQDEACSHFKAGAEQGYAPAQHYLAECYERGVSVMDRAANMKRWYEAAAAQGAWTSHCALGNQYLDGALIESDPRRGYEMCKEAADNGSSLGNVTVGKLLIQGWNGRPDYEEASKYLTRAAADQNPEAAYLLSRMHYDGDKRMQSSDKALAYAQFAGRRSHRPAFILIARYLVSNLSAELSTGGAGGSQEPGWEVYYWSALALRHDKSPDAQRDAERYIKLLENSVPADTLQRWKRRVQVTPPARM